MHYFYQQKSGVLNDARLIFQEAPKAPEAPEAKAQMPKEVFEAPKTIEGSKEFSDRQVKKTEKVGGIALENNKFGDTVPNPEYLTGEKLAKLAKEQPQIILGSAEQLKDQPEFPKLLETAARKAAEINPGSAVRLDSAFKTEPYHREVLNVALTNLAESDPRTAIENAQAKLGDSPETRILIKKAQTNLSRFNHYA